MKHLIVILLFSAFADKALSQTPETIRLATLLERMQASGDKILVVNFWATWCAPCIKELPLFEKLQAERSAEVKVTLVSMDLDLDSNPEKVYKFIARKKLQSEVVLLSEKDPNSWINQIDESWSGALPATVIINQKTGERKFIEKELHEGDLERLIEEVK
jgi:thiol-disulfide isomerase/thioredoxin